MKTIIRLLLIGFFFTSCSKSDPTPDPTPTPIPIPDTLTTGWSKTGAGIPSNAKIYDVYFTGNTIGFATTDQGIFKSTDGGVNWALFNSVNTAVNIGGLGNRYCFAGSNMIHYTTNGTDFFTKTISVPSIGFRDCFVASPSVLYACSGRYIYKSTDGGINFDSVYVFPSDGVISSAIFFTSITEGWLMRSDGLYKTTNGGVNWSQVYTANSSIGSIDFLNSNTALVSSDLLFLKTTNGGLNWNSIFTAAVYAGFDVDIISPSEMYIAANNKIYKSVDGGASFTQVLSSAQNAIIEIHFIDSNNGWACGYNGAIYRYKQ
jgi:photosystem II stability/assembly factor-like uncharacterized protein